MVPEEAQPVFLGEHTRAFCFWPGRRRLMVRFSHWKAGKTGFEPVKAWNTLRESDCTVLTIQTARNDWLLNDDYPALRPELRVFCRNFDHVGALGFSMGGYAALLLAPQLKLKKAVLVSPQYSIQPQKVPFERRYWREAKAIRKRFDRFDMDYAPRLEGVVIYDPNRADDTRHKELICADFPRLTPVPCRFGGHPATRIIHKDGRWGAFVRATTSEGTDPPLFLRMHKSVRSKSRQYQNGLATYLVDRKRRR